MAHDPATIAADLVLVEQPLTHTGVAHTALLTYACHNTSSSNPQAIADAVQTAFNDNIPPNLDNNVTAGRPTIQLGNGTAVPEVAIASGATVDGSVSAEFPPPTVAVLAKKVTGLGGRKNRGRLYIPWAADEAAVAESGQIDSGQVSDLQVTFTAWLADLVTADLPMVIANRTISIDPDTLKPYVSAFTLGADVTQLLCENYVATQRRRMPRPS